MKPTIERIRELFAYDPIEGTLTRKIDTKCARKGTVLRASVRHRVPVWVDGVTVHHHVLCWAHHHGRWPTLLIDHQDRNIGNSRIDNLREATHAQNQWNKGTTNPYGKGVTWRDRKAKPWLAKIRVNGVRINLGSFATAEEAAMAYREACIKYHGTFGCMES